MDGGSGIGRVALLASGERRTTWLIQLSKSQRRFNCRTVIASEAKQSISPRKETMDCFVASLLAMTSL
jgi:hypothetical protein